MKWILLITLISLSSVRGLCQTAEDSTVILTKRAALYYYEQKKLADFFKKRTFSLKTQLDSSFSVIKEKNVQLGTYKVELDAHQTLYNALNIRYGVAQTDITFLQVKVRRTRRERNLAVVVGIASVSAAGYLAYKSLVR
jgi:hypothetical protein